MNIYNIYKYNIYIYIYIYINIKVNEHYAGQNLEIYVVNNWKLQQHSRANKQKKHGRYFTI